MPVTTLTSVSGYASHTGTLQEVLDALGGSGAATGVRSPANVVAVFVNGAGFTAIVKL